MDGITGSGTGLGICCVQVRTRQYRINACHKHVNTMVANTCTCVD